MSLSGTSLPVLPGNALEDWGGAAPFSHCWRWWHFCWHQGKTGWETLQQSLWSLKHLPPVLRVGTGTWNRSQLFLGGSCQTSSDAHTGTCPSSLCLGPLLMVAQRPSFVPSSTFSEGLHIPMGYSHPMLQTLSGQKGKEASSPHHPPPQSHLVTKGSLMPSSGEGDSAVPSHATQDLSPSKSHLEIMNPPGLRGFQAL